MTATKPLTLTQVCLCPNLTFHDAESEYLRFEVGRPLTPRKTHFIRVYNDREGSWLGTITFRPGWRQYVYEPEVEAQTVYSAGCLTDITRVLECMNKQRRSKR